MGSSSESGISFSCHAYFFSFDLEHFHNLPLCVCVCDTGIFEEYSFLHSP